MPLNEADTRAQLIDPQINRSGWTRSQIRREHFYKTDWQYTAGKVVLRGDRAERAKPKRVDYLLRYTESFPIAVVEAKAEGRSANDGLQYELGDLKEMPESDDLPSESFSRDGQSPGRSPPH